MVLINSLKYIGLHILIYFLTNIRMYFLVNHIIQQDQQIIKKKNQEDI